jgi:predicted nucleic acid-binding protein
VTSLVLDASAAIDLVLGTTKGKAVKNHLAQFDGDVYAPDHFFAETTHVLDRYALARTITGRRAWQCIEELEELVTAVGIGAHLSLAWLWRGERRSIYDLLYVAVAKRLDAQLITCDRRQADAAREEQVRVEHIQ